MTSPLDSPTAVEIGAAHVQLAWLSEDDLLHMIAIARPHVADADGWLASLRDLWATLPNAPFTAEQIKANSDAIMVLARARL